MKKINAKFSLPIQYPVYFEHDVFNVSNTRLVELLNSKFEDVTTSVQSVYVFIDQGVVDANVLLLDRITNYFKFFNKHINLVARPQVIVGGEAVKSQAEIENMYQQLLLHKIDRHNVVISIGGGAVLDAVGYVCATFHRGIKLLRMPSTVLAQNDVGVSVKNGFNAFDTKNLIGTFCPPMAVLNDAALLDNLSARDHRAGLAEAVKVAAIRSQSFFGWMEDNIDALCQFEPQASQYAIAKCAELHLAQITKTGDPFESGSARPLDYGHWSAHKLEALAKYKVRHGEAVAIGMALDAKYAVEVGLLAEGEAYRLINLLKNLGFVLWHPVLEQLDEQGQSLILSGLEEFRQHLGGELRITLLTQIGTVKDVNYMELQALSAALKWLKKTVNTAGSCRVVA